MVARSRSRSSTSVMGMTRCSSTNTRWRIRKCQLRAWGVTARQHSTRSTVSAPIPGGGGQRLSRSGRSSAVHGVSAPIPGGGGQRLSRSGRSSAVHGVSAPIPGGAAVHGSQTAARTGMSWRSAGACSSRSMAPTGEQAWHRAQPAATRSAVRPRSTRYGATLRATWST